MAGQRLFVALDLPRVVRDALAQISPYFPGLRPLPPEQIHLTLSFLGHVAAAPADVLREKLCAICFQKFFLPIVGLGTFPAHGNVRVLWVGVGSGHPQLFLLHQRVQEAALGAGLGPDLGAWRPHLTIARCRDVAATSLRPFLQRHADFDAGLAPVDSFSLYSSIPGPEGSAYTRELAVSAS